MQTRPHRETEKWEDRLKYLLPLLGHRNWVVVADSAYPAQSNPGIETIVTGADHIQVLAETLRVIAGCGHVRAETYMDAELRHVPEEDAPGVRALRDEIDRLLKVRRICELEHEQIISRLDKSASLFRIVILKSTLTIPYTSIFFELKCGYWSEDAERRFRHSLAHEGAAA